MNQPSLATPDGGDAYHVMFTGGELRILSLDELDEAFNGGRIDERTFVLAPGSQEWTRLGNLLGLDVPPDAPAPIAKAPVAFAPVMAPVPQLTAQPITPAFDFGIPSTRPMAFDIDDVNEESLRPKRRAPLVVAAALVALGVGGFFAYKSVNARSDVSMTAAAAAAAVPATPPAYVPPTITPSAPVVAPIDDNKRAALSDNQKARLAAADKDHATKSAAKHAARAAGSSGGHHKHSKEKVFNNGGAAGDPLNAAL